MTHPPRSASKDDLADRLANLKEDVEGVKEEHHGVRDDDAVEYVEGEATRADADLGEAADNLIDGHDEAAAKDVERGLEQ